MLCMNYILYVYASRGAAVRSVTVKPTGCGFDPHSRRWNVYLNLYFHFFALVSRLTATQNAIPPEFGRKWGTECLNNRFPLPTLLCAGYSVKLIWFICIILNIFLYCIEYINTRFPGFFCEVETKSVGVDQVTNWVVWDSREISGLLANWKAVSHFLPCSKIVIGNPLSKYSILHFLPMFVSVLSAGEWK